MHHSFAKRALAFVATLGIALVPASPAFASGDKDFPTRTPIKHVVVIFQENVSFDHYFGTYPHAANLPGEIPFQAKTDTPGANTLEAAGLLTNNPNTAQPFRIPPSIPVTCDEDHNYNDEQAAFDGGLMDKFVQKLSCNDAKLGSASVMGYYDGNTVTAFWNYVQHFAMSDNFYGTTFGPSTPGALNLIAGNTFGATLVPVKPNGAAGSGVGQIANGGITGAVIGDPRPGFDDCSSTTAGLAGSNQITMNGKNVGNLLNAKGITWGWFQGGFAPTGVDAKGRVICGQHHVGLSGDDQSTQSSNGDYIPHHQPFQYYASTANPHHTRPSGTQLIGTSNDGANHQYDLDDFFAALKSGNLPAVSYLKAGAYQDGHAGYSNPIDEQTFVVNVVNTLMKSNEWPETAVMITYDDSDGWYDHQMSPIVMQSSVSDDRLLGPGNCGSPKSSDVAGGTQNGRCGYGPRFPFLLISSFAKANYIDHTITDLSSVLRFVEDNWDLGRIGNGSVDAIAGPLDGMFDFSDQTHGNRGHDNQGNAGKLILDPTTGQIAD
jgi:phospholipase C